MLFHWCFIFYMNLIGGDCSPFYAEYWINAILLIHYYESGGSVGKAELPAVLTLKIGQWVAEKIAFEVVLCLLDVTAISTTGGWKERPHSLQMILPR